MLNDLFVERALLIVNGTKGPTGSAHGWAFSRFPISHRDTDRAWHEISRDGMPVFDVRKNDYVHLRVAFRRMKRLRRE
jgi:hypothetical protein